ncbi:aldose epimerase family protein [Roseibium alexandrii]|uniref:Aldose 1-epimerase n=1 Tax=Roseibium alexandrii (strain DSM 17067 / NCIMB 14079 / DFL-11) TaxID=244592 RepID=A0A5E8H3K6_ROSAD|nr:aldose epimerase family protein [Roseibium alexandrii]EEE46449.1 Galactose mutarotase/related enzyme [Roseibium alexandrii DFL-11]
MIQEFGVLPDGKSVEEITLKKGDLEASVLTFGAIIRDLKFAGQSVVLGFDNLQDYLDHSPYFGAIVGRCANRIANGKIAIDGRAYHLDQNDNGHHLHGGSKGFSQRNWQIEQSDKASVLLKLVSEDEDMGYPGRVEALVRYTLTGSGALRVKLSATTDQTTPVNLSQHSYFNLDGSNTILDHQLEIAAETYVPVEDHLIPTGQIRSVAWTPYDFQDGRRLRRKSGEEAVIYDHNFCLSDAPRDTVEFAAALEDKSGDRRMEVWTTEPGLQLYDGGKIDVPVPGLAGKNYGAHAGLCLEAQRWPDSVNQKTFTDVLLRPHASYNQVTEFRFS